MPNLSLRQAGVILLVIVVVVGASPAYTISVGAESGIQNPTDSVPDDQLFEGSDDGQIEVWNRGAYPLRTDDTGAASQAGLPDPFQGQTLGSGNDFTSGNDGTDSKSFVTSFNSERNPAGVHDSGSISISFNDDRAQSSALEGQDNVSFLAANITGEGGEGVPEDYSSAVTLFSDIDNANANASFRMLKENVSIASDGTYDFSANFDPGYHIIYTTVREDGNAGFQVNSENNVSVSGDVAIVGAEAVAVHEAEASVSEPSNPNPGDTLDFDIDTTAAFDSSQDGSVTHTVAVYEKGVFEDSRLDIVINESALGTDFNLTEHSQVEHSIANANGVADVEDGIEINGIDLSDGEVSRAVGLGAIVDRLAEDLSTNDPLTDPIDAGGASNSDTEDIDASVRAVSGQDRDTTVSVDTFDNFSTDTYQYIVISQLDNDATSYSTETGTIDIQSDSGGGGGGDDEPAVSLDPSSLDFGDVEINTTATESFDIENTGDADLDVSSFEVTGDDADQFDIESDPGDATISPGGSETVTVSFSPTSQGDASAAVEFDSNDGSQSVDLSGTGIEVTGAVSVPSEVDFGDVEVDSTATEEFTIENTGNAPVDVSSFGVTGDDADQFELESGAGDETIGAGENKTVSVTFAPTAGGSASAAVEFDTNVTSDTQSVELSGTGVLPGVDLNPSEVDFGRLGVGDTATESFEIANTGNTSLTVGSFSLTGRDAGQFDLESGATTSTIAPGENKTVSVTFAPTDRGRANARVRFNAPGGTQSIPLTGIGVGPEIDVPGVVDFGNVDIDTTAQANLSIENTGNAPMSVTLRGPNSDVFAVTTDQTEFVIPAGSTQTVPVTFTPTSFVPSNARVRVSSNATARPRVTVGLTGTGAAPAVEVSPSDTLDFGDVPRGTDRTRSLVISSVGSEPLSIDGVSVSGTSSESFAVGAVPGSVAPGRSAVVDITLQNATAFEDAQVDVTTNAGNASVDISATVQNPSVTDPDREIAFGNVPVGSSVSEELTIENDGEADLTVDLAGAFAGTPFELRTQGASLNVAPGESESLRVAFSPQATGEFEDSATLDTNAPDADITIDVTGTGTETDLRPAPTTLTFDVGRNGTATEEVTLTNEGNQAISGLTAEITPADSPFTVVDAPTELDGGASAEVTVEFDPVSAGSATGRLEMSGNNNTALVSLEGEARPPRTQFDREALPLGYVAVGETNTRSLRISNRGPADTTVTANFGAATITDDQFALGANAPERVTLDGGESQAVPITFTPDAQGPQETQLEVPTNDPDRPTLTMTLRGVGSGPEATVTEPADGTIDFGETPIDTQSRPRTVTVRNTGGATLSIDSISAEGSFTVLSEPRRSSLVPDGTARIRVAATPEAGDIENGATATVSGSIVVETNDPDGNSTVTLEAEATKPVASVSDSIDAFGDVGVGTSSVQEITISNDGAAPLDLDAPSIEGADAFSVISGDSADRLAPDEQTEIGVAYAPTSSGGSDEGTLTIGTNDPDTETIEADLEGSGVDSDVQFSRAALGFGTVGIGDSASASLSVTNTGGSDTTIQDVRLEGEDSGVFEVTNAPGSGTTLSANGGSEEIDLSVSPVARGSLGARLVVELDSQTITANLGARGASAELDVGEPITFDRTRVGARSAAETVEVSNTGNLPLDISSVEISGDDAATFRVVDSPDQVAPKSSEQIEVQFAPAEFNAGIPSDAVTDAKDGTPQTATLNISSDAGDGSVRLSGTGETPDLNRSTSALQFGTIAIGDRAVRTFRVRNDISASANITIDDVSLFGASVEELDIENDDEVTGQTLTPGDSVEINVSLEPDTPGVKTGVVSLSTNDPRQSGQATFVSNTRTVARITLGSAISDYEEVEAGVQPPIEFNRGLETNGSIRGFQPNVSTTDDFTLRTEGYESADGAPVQPATSDSFAVLRFVNATVTVSDDELEDNTFRFRVSKTALADLDRSPENVTLRRFDGTAYQELPTTLVDETRTSYVYEGTTESLSDFAIAVETEEEVPDGVDRFRNEFGLVDSQGLLDAAAAFRDGEISSQTLLDVAAAFRNQDSVDQFRNEQGVVDPQGLLDAAAAFRNGQIDSQTLLDVAAAFRNEN